MRKILSVLAFVFLFAFSLNASAAVIYDSNPSPLPANFASLGYQATSTAAAGDYVHLSGTERNLTTVTVGMSDWALYSDYIADVRYMSDSVKWTHPITVNIYSNQLDVNGVPTTLLATKTQTVDIPWRPAADPTCSTPTAWRAGDGNCYNGFAFNATFDLTSLNVTLPNDVIVSFAYDTQTYGKNPIGLNGPYNSLNVGIPTSQVPTVGSDDNADKIYWDTTYPGYTAGLKEDFGWTPNGTVSMQINALTPCNANGSGYIVSDTGTMNVTDSMAAVLLSFIHPAWDAVIPGASWVWATNPVTGPTSGPDVTKVFSKTFNITGTPTGGTLDIAADNNYTVKVNGNTVPVVFDQNNFQSSTQDSYNIGAYLVTGSNTIEVSVTNWQVGQDPDPAANPAGLLYKLSYTNNECVTPEPATSSTVHIFKFIDGVQATTGSANGVNFPMFTPTYNAPFTLGPNGWTGGDIAYEASTSPMAIGSNYSAYENTTTPLVGTTCDGTHPYALAGYSTGSTMQFALNNPVTTTAPNFTNLQGDQYVIVHNKTCTVTPPVKVHILKYLDGVMATNTSAAGFQFPMTATWQTANLNGGVSTSGNYVLGNNHGGATDQYGADTAPMAVPADYTTSEVIGGNIVDNVNSCAAGKYVLKGYKTSSVSFAAAAAATLTVTAPVFTGISADQYVIVLNEKCPTTGTISGTKYNDLDRDGKKDTNESGLQGWTIKLTNTVTGAVLTTVTGVNGKYTFTNIAPGTYKVREVHQNGWKRMSKNPKKIVIIDGSNVTDVNFGNAQKKKSEKEDNDKDDNRDDEDGEYHGNHGNSNYDKDHDKKEHDHDDKNDKKDNNKKNR